MCPPSLQISTSTDARDSASAEISGAAVEEALDVFLSERTRLFRIAHRVTGDRMSAEDVVQEAWLRWQRTDHRVIKNPAAFLTTATTHLAINVIQSARHRHETYTESPLAELTDPDQDPTAHAEQTCAVEETLLLLMARLSPAELAAYLLRKGFEYPYAAIATLLGTTGANARQLVRRAQLRIEGDSVRGVDADAHRELVTAFLTAARTGELRALEEILGRAARPTTRTHQRPPVRPMHPSARPRVA